VAAASVDGLLPVMAETVVPILGWLCVIGIIYGALVAWVQEDVKKLVAYSSVSHLGFCVLGLLALNSTGMQGSVFYMINHGISTGALFLMIGMIYDRYHTRMFRDYSGLGRVMPVYSFFLVLFAMSSIGLPGTNGFVSEFLTILGAFTSPVLGFWFGVTATLGVILGAVYMLHMVARLIFGPLKLPTDSHAHDAPRESTVEGHAHDPHTNAGSGAHQPKSLDLNGREIAILTPLAIAVIVLGVLPTPLLKSIAPSVEQAQIPAAVQAYDRPERPVPATATGRRLSTIDPAGAADIAVPR
jgi:NADH-quinone oxidoreductase subunit M